MALTNLPQAPKVKPHSKRGRWRALVLVLVHVAFVAHLMHWKATGSTMTPVEPSESMQTLELGLVNAGFVLFLALILSTLVFGRFFCGWACHVVALQDLCGWVLKKLGVRPKPFRSRLLVFVPLFAALYMFVWPSAQRVFSGGPLLPKLQAHFQTESFWATFPGPGIAILTLAICGFLAVYLLGNKGFCTYGCPYGAVFYHADRVAPGKIRVTDACDSCGHCTSVCTSNVRVHEEVKASGAVVDAGCMKCFDCVDACPKGALYYAFGAPSLLTKKAKTRRDFDFSVGEEILMAVVFGIAFYAFRGLYDAVPFLLTLGLGSISAFLGVHAWRVFRRPQVRLQRWQLKSAGRIRGGGWAVLTVIGLWFAFIAQSTIYQWHIHEARAEIVRADAARLDRPIEATEAAKAGLGHFERALAVGLFPVAAVERQRGDLYAFVSDPRADPAYAKALSLAPNDPNIRYSYAKYLRANGKWQPALDQLSGIEKLGNFDQVGGFDIDRLRGDSHVGLKQYPAAVGAYERYLAKNPNDESAVAARELASIYAELDRNPARALDTAERVLKEQPLSPAILQIWAEAVKKLGKLDATLVRLIRARPSDQIAWTRAAYLYRARGDQKTSEQILSRFQVLP